jgi:hypothetical protein
MSQELQDPQETKVMLALGAQAKAHLQKARPKLYAELEANGQLEATILAMQNRAEEQILAAVQKGKPWSEAFEEAKPDLFLPSEEEQPLLGTQGPTL